MIKSLMIAALLVLGGCAYEKVPPGTVGVMVNLYGSGKGVQAQQVGPGRYWVGYNQDLYTFPTFTQTYTWTSDRNEGRPQDEAFHFQSVEGIELQANVGVTYHVDPDKVSVLFQKYRKGIDEITDVYIHNMIRDGFQQEASKQPVEMLYGKGKTDLVSNVQKYVQDQISPYGLQIEKVYLVGGVKPPQQVTDAINAKIAATQKAEQRNNEIAQAQAEASKEVAVAEGRGKSNLVIAQAQAQSNLAIAEAEAKAIRVRGDALRDNPGVVQYTAVTKWNGELPQFMGGGQNGSMPIIGTVPLGAK